MGLRIIEGREAIALSQKELADKLKISDRTLRRYEQGETVPDALTWIKIEHLLNNIVYMMAELDLYSASQAREVAQKKLKAKSSIALQKAIALIKQEASQGRVLATYSGVLNEFEQAILEDLGYRVKWVKQISGYQITW